MRMEFALGEPKWSLAWLFDRAGCYRMTQALDMRARVLAAHENAGSVPAVDVQALIDTVVNAILTVDEKCIIRSFNLAAEQLFGYCADEAIGQPISSLLSEPHLTSHQQDVSHYLAAHEQHTVGIGREVKARHKDGSLLPLYLTISEFKVAGERRFAGFLHDISATDLEARQLLERLAQADLSSKLAETAAAMAHELNQPLAAVATYAEAARRQLSRGDSAKLATTLNKVIEQSLRASAVVDHVLRLVNGATGGEAATQLADINALMAEVVALTRTAASRQGIELVLQTVPELPAVRCDPVQIRQVGLNLVRNAIDAVGQARRRHGHAVCVDTHVATDAVEVSVSDCGDGVSDSVRDSIFAPFRGNKPGGMGMGLAICRTIIVNHRGTLRFEDNAPNPGTTFSFALPVDNA